MLPGCDTAIEEGLRYSLLPGAPGERRIKARRDEMRHSPSRSQQRPLRLRHNTSAGWRLTFVVQLFFSISRQICPDVRRKKERARGRCCPSISEELPGRVG